MCLKRSSWSRAAPPLPGGAFFCAGSASNRVGHDHHSKPLIRPAIFAFFFAAFDGWVMTTLCVLAAAADRPEVRLQLAAFHQRLRQRARVDMFQLAAHRQTACNAADLQPARAQHLGQIMRGASPSTVKLVLRMTSCTMPSLARSSSRAKAMSCVPMPSSGSSAPSAQSTSRDRPAFAPPSANRWAFPPRTIAHACGAHPRKSRRLRLR